jgi:hypothetical protein
MNRENFEKLLQANREAPSEVFDMRLFIGKQTECGTPACLLGNLALRRDLQNEIKVVSGWSVVDNEGHPVWCDGTLVRKYFDITARQAGLLFGEDGCNRAGTNRDKALAYVEHFMATGETPYDEDEDEDADYDYDYDDEGAQ